MAVCTYVFSYSLDNQGNAVKGSRDETGEMVLSVDDSQPGGTEQLDEVLDFVQRFLVSAGFTWAAEGTIRYVKPDNVVVKPTPVTEEELNNLFAEDLFWHGGEPAPAVKPDNGPWGIYADGNYEIGN